MLLCENAKYLLSENHLGWGIEAENCQEVYEFLEKNGYVDFENNRKPYSRFIREFGIHYVRRNGKYLTGLIVWPAHNDDYGSDYWLPISFEDFVVACDNGGETFADIPLEGVLGL